MNDFLFSDKRRTPPPAQRKEPPLARRIAPRSLDEIRGQEHILGPGKLLRRAIDADRLTSVIFYGPPGCGKTALARVIAMRTKSVVEPLNAVLAGIADIRKVVKSARDRFEKYQQSTILFLDEIHRFTKTQQDGLLPHVENGLFTLIGATTENPYFSIVSPLLSRSQIFEFKALTQEDIRELLLHAIAHPKRGFSDLEIQLDDDALEYITRFAEGDGRRAVNALELALLTTKPVGNTITVTLAIAAESIQKKMLHYDGSGDSHYDAASAFIKSMRGSHPDAALYWMGRMIEAGEPPRFIARRICIAAAEEVGCADPQALILANAAFQTADLVGFPEARIILAQAAVYVAAAPKSNAVYQAVDKALKQVREGSTIEVPAHLKESSYKGAEKLERGKGYLYAHDYEDAYVPQDYGIPRGAFYEPHERGQEKEIKMRLEALEARDKEQAQSEGEKSGAEEHPDVSDSETQES
ncbi:MAG: replication-associated recombination protein A [Candidatus Hydrogenedens sp.]|jgi:putative ATPase|nr:replication-associated recombination protein A [Candidatus Hydrogenedens sp.]